MDEDLKRLLREKNKVDGSEKQTRETVSNALKTKLKEQMAEFRLAEKLLNEHKEVIERRFFALTGEQIQEEKLD